MTTPSCKCGRMLMDDDTCVYCGHGPDPTSPTPLRFTGARIARVVRSPRHPAVPVIGGPHDRRPWTRTMVRAAIRRWHQETGRTPRQAEWASAGPWWPSARRVCGLFPTWKHAIRAAGFEPPAQGRPATPRHDQEAA